MKNSKFNSIESGLYDASALQSTQLKAITGGTTWTSGGTNGSDSIDPKTLVTTYSDGTTGKNKDGNL